MARATLPLAGKKAPRFPILPTNRRLISFLFFLSYFLFFHWYIETACFNYGSKRVLILLWFVWKFSRKTRKSFVLESGVDWPGVSLLVCYRYLALTSVCLLHCALHSLAVSHIPCYLLRPLNWQTAPTLAAWQVVEVTLPYGEIRERLKSILHFAGLVVNFYFDNRHGCLPKLPPWTFNMIWINLSHEFNPL